MARLVYPGKVEWLWLSREISRERHAWFEMHFMEGNPLDYGATLWNLMLRAAF